MNTVFSNRCDAGQKLAKKLVAYTDNPNAIVLGLPRGGVVVAHEIAKSLNLPLDVCLVRKLSLPNNPEAAMGAIAKDTLLPQDSNAVTIIDQNTTEIHRLQPDQIQAIAAKEKTKLKRRESCYRNYRPIQAMSNHTVILADDGMATGLTMCAAITLVRQHQPKEIIIAIPVSSKQAISKVTPQVDDVIYLVMPNSLGAVGFWYEDFSQVTDKEVCDLLS